MIRKLKSLEIYQLIKLRMLLTIVSMVPFLALFIDRVIRGTFDSLSLIYVFVYIFLQIVGEYVHSVERKKWLARGSVSDEQWREMQEALHIRSKGRRRRVTDFPRDFDPGI